MPKMKVEMVFDFPKEYDNCTEGELKQLVWGMTRRSLHHVDEWILDIMSTPLSELPEEYGKYLLNSSKEERAIIEKAFKEGNYKSFLITE